MIHSEWLLLEHLTQMHTLLDASTDMVAETGKLMSVSWCHFFVVFFAGHGSCSAAPMFTNILQSGVSVLPWFASYLNNSTQCVPGRLSLQYCTECHMLQFSNWSRSCCTLLTCCSWYNDIIIIHKRMLMTRKFTGPVIRLWLYRALILLNLALFRAPLCLRSSWCYICINNFVAKTS